MRTLKEAIFTVNRSPKVKEATISKEMGKKNNGSKEYSGKENLPIERVRYMVEIMLVRNIISKVS